MKNYEEIFSIFSSIGVIFRIGGDFEKSIFCFSLCFKLEIKIKNKDKVSDCFKNIGVLYSYLHKFQNENIEKLLLNNNQKNNLNTNISGSLNNFQFDINSKNNINNSLKIRNQEPNQEIFQTNYNICSTKSKLYFKKSIYYLEKSLRLKNNIFQILDLQLEIGKLYYNDKNFIDSKIYLENINKIVDNEIFRYLNEKSKNDLFIVGIKKFKAISCRFLGSIYKLQQNENAFQYFFQISEQILIQNLDFFKKKNYYFEQSDYLNQLAIIFYFQSKFDIALKYFFDSLNIKIKINDNIGKLEILKNIATIYLKQNQFKKSKLYFLSCLKLQNFINNIELKNNCIKFLKLIDLKLKSIKK